MWLQRAGKAGSHDIEVISVNQDVIEVPIHRFCEGKDQILIDSCHWDASCIEDFGRMLNDLFEA